MSRCLEETRIGREGALGDFHRQIVEHIAIVGTARATEDHMTLILATRNRAGQLAQALLKRGIIVREMKAWNLPEYIRVTIGLPEENRAFITALKEELS